MEVILKQDVDKVGKAGQIVKVKDGFARNFLILRGLAVPSTVENLKTTEKEREKKLQQSEKIKKEAEELADRLSDLSLTLPALTKEDDKLYGGISAIDLSAALKEEGFDIDKSKIMLDEPIKALGIYEINIKLHQEVTAKIKVWVVKK